MARRMMKCIYWGAPPHHKGATENSGDMDIKKGTEKLKNEKWKTKKWIIHWSEMTVGEGRKQEIRKCWSK